MRVCFFTQRRLPCLASAFVGATALLVPLATPLAAHAQLLTNGSFEAGNFTGSNPQGAANATQLFVGATNITGWTVVNAELAWLQSGNPYGFPNSDGVRSLDLTGYHDASPYGGVSQTIATTAGSVYNLSFDIGAAAGNTSGIMASAGAASQNFTFSATSSGASFQYGTQSFNFTAGAGTTSTAISLIGSSTTFGTYLGLDNVKVTLVSGGAGAPEPGTLSLVGMGLITGAGMVGTVKRRKAKGTAKQVA